MTLDEFIAAKPTELRLGQFFVITYCKAVKVHWEAGIDNMWNLDDNEAKNAIMYCMDKWQWDSLPELVDANTCQSASQA